MKQLESLCFKVHGDYITDFFRDLVLDGDPNKALMAVLDGICGITIQDARKILKGEKRFEGVNDLAFIDDEEGLDDRYMINLCWVYRNERCVAKIWTKEELHERMKDIPPEDKWDGEDNGEVWWRNVAVDYLDQMELRRVEPINRYCQGPLAKLTRHTIEERNLNVEISRRGPYPTSESLTILPPGYESPHIRSQDEYKQIIVAQNKTIREQEKTIGYQEKTIGYQEDTISVQADTLDSAVGRVEGMLGRGGGADPLMQQIKAMDETIDMDEKVTGLPDPVEVEPEDTQHFTWIIDPEGNLYRMPYQAHEEWVEKYKAYLPYDDYTQATKHGWVRVSGGVGLGLAIDFNPATPVNYQALKSFMGKLSYHTFTMNVVDTEKFVIGIDYKEALRIVNEAQRGKFKT